MSNDWSFPDPDEETGLDGLANAQPSGPPHGDRLKKLNFGISEKGGI